MTTRLAYRHDEFRLIRDQLGRPIWNMHNAITLLSKHRDWDGVLAYNQFTVQRELHKPIPGQVGGSFPRPLEDDDYAAALAWFNCNGLPRASIQLLQAAIRKVCRQYSYDPLCDYLEGLKWDGRPRLAYWLATYCGADNSQYTSEIGKRWCIAAVARALNPGCKVDNMLVLEGKQGRRKSSALSALAGEEWFADALPPMGSKDAQSYLRGKWIIEVAELEAMRRVVDAVKAFITRQVETYRPAYGREEVSEPRRCVFAGTTNKDDWQRDATGGRRFWPVKVGEIDVVGLMRDRDQLWAEAVALYRSGERWWLQGSVEEQALVETAERRPDDPWRADIAGIVTGKTEVHAKQILGEMNVNPTDMTPQLARRVTEELIAQGWEKAGRVTSGEGKGAARYVPAIR